MILSFLKIQIIKAAQTVYIFILKKEFIGNLIIGEKLPTADGN